MAGPVHAELHAVCITAGLVLEAWAKSVCCCRAARVTATFGWAGLLRRILLRVDLLLGEQLALNRCLLAATTNT